MEIILIMTILITTTRHIYWINQLQFCTAMKKTHSKTHAIPSSKSFISSIASLGILENTVLE